MLICAGIAANAAPVRIVAIGASNTHGWYVSNQGAYPAQLEALLIASFWKLCRATPLTPVERPPPGKPGPSTPLLPKGKPRRGKRGFQQRTALGIGGILGAVLQALVARASGGVQSGSGCGRAAMDRFRSSALGQRCSPALTSW
jgi:hypothetical protein